jgi:nitrate reductase delta subunit
MRPAEVVALGYRYPDPAGFEVMAEAVEVELTGAVQRRMRRFVRAIGLLSQVQREEQHTRTLDLSPVFVPYVGHAIWGENYRRGEFMADLTHDMELHGVDLGGELPDHIEPVLRYLAVTSSPLPDLMDVLGAAVDHMNSTLRSNEPSSPYRHLIGATKALIEHEKSVAIGVRT